MPDAAFRREAWLRGVIPNGICSELEPRFEKSFIGKAGIRRIPMLMISPGVRRRAVSAGVRGGSIPCRNAAQMFASAATNETSGF
jgi:hypothetical protein